MKGFAFIASRELFNRQLISFFFLSTTFIDDRTLIYLRNLTDKTCSREQYLQELLGKGNCILHDSTFLIINLADIFYNRSEVCKFEAAMDVEYFESILREQSRLADDFFCIFLQFFYEELINNKTINELLQFENIIKIKQLANKSEALSLIMRIHFIININ